MQSNASSSQHEMEEKMRKLQQMKQQEEEFDKHLAQTVPVSCLNNSYFCYIVVNDLIIFFFLSISESSICIWVRIKAFWYFKTKYPELCAKYKQQCDTRYEPATTWLSTSSTIRATIIER